MGAQDRCLCTVAEAAGVQHALAGWRAEREILGETAAEDVPNAWVDYAAECRTC